VLETAIKKYVINGLGISYLPYYAVMEESEKGLLRIRFPETDLRFFTQIVYHRKKWLSPAMKIFIDLCREYGRK
jgi:DNA-binding transcriptional LysR family regulator